MRLFAIALDASAAQAIDVHGPSGCQALRLADLQQVAERDLLHAHERLRVAQARARCAAGTDPTLQALARRLHSSACRASAHADKAEVVDVQARDLTASGADAPSPPGLEPGTAP